MILQRVTTATSKERPLLIIDGDNLAHRAYHSMPKSLKSPDGRPINAIVGWTNMLVTLWESEQPRSIYVAWDTLGVDTYRHELWPTYQGGRVFDNAIVRQLDLLPVLSAAFGFGVGKGAGYEADDFMAGAAIAETKRGGRSLLLTTDRDAYQLVNDSVMVLAPRKGVRDLMRIGPAEVVERMGVLPEQVPGLQGDRGRRVGRHSGRQRHRTQRRRRAAAEVRHARGDPGRPHRHHPGQPGRSTAHLQARRLHANRGRRRVAGDRAAELGERRGRATPTRRRKSVRANRSPRSRVATARDRALIDAR